MLPILDRLLSGEILMSDGALGTMLFQRGLKPGQCPELWNLERPEVLKELFQLYIEAGAEIIHANTFGASPIKLAEFGLEDKSEEINRSGIELVRTVSEGQVYVGASCGSSGRLLKPYGDTDPEALYESYLQQMKSLTEAGVDLITIETMIDLNEAIIAVNAARHVSQSIPVIASMSFDKTPNGYFTVMGTSIEDAARGLEAAGADVIGSNCGNGLEEMIEIAREFSALSSLPLIIQSNAGLPQIKNGKLNYTEKETFFKERTPELVEAGVSIIGGCCGTTPDYIRAMKSVI